MIEETFEQKANVVWRLIRRLFLWIVGIYVLFSYVPNVLLHMKSIALSVLAAVLLTYILLPWVELLCKRRVSSIKPLTQRIIASVFVVVMFLVVTGFLIALFIEPFQQEIEQFAGNSQKYAAKLQGWVDSVGDWYQKSVPAGVKTAIGRADYSSVSDWAANYVRQLFGIIGKSVGVIVELLLIPVLAFYFLVDYRTVTKEIYGLVPHIHTRDALRIGRSSGTILQSYVFGQLILCAIAGALTGFVLWILGMPYVIVLALLAAVTRAIPIIGPVVSGVPIVLIGLLYSDSMVMPVVLALFTVVMHFAESKFIMPQLIGHRLKLHPAVVIIVLLVGAQFFGLIGMFLAAPVAAVIRELVRIYYISPYRRPIVQES